MQQMQAEQSSCLQQQAIHNNTAIHTCMQKTAHANNIHSFLSPLSGTDTHIRIHIEGTLTHSHRNSYRSSSLHLKNNYCWHANISCLHEDRGRGVAEEEKDMEGCRQSSCFTKKNNILSSLMRTSLETSRHSLTNAGIACLICMREICWQLKPTKSHNPMINTNVVALITAAAGLYIVETKSTVIICRIFNRVM